MEGGTSIEGVLKKKVPNHVNAFNICVNATFLILFGMARFDEELNNWSCIPVPDSDPLVVDAMKTYEFDAFPYDEEYKMSNDVYAEWKYLATLQMILNGLVITDGALASCLPNVIFNSIYIVSMVGIVVVMIMTYSF